MTPNILHMVSQSAFVVISRNQSDYFLELKRLIHQEKMNLKETILIIS